MDNIETVKHIAQYEVLPPGSCVSLDADLTISDNKRYDTGPGQWEGELCSTAASENGLASGSVVVRSLGVCITDAWNVHALVSREGRMAAADAGPHEITVRVMGPEVVGAEVVHMGGCKYAASSTHIDMQYFMHSVFF